LKSQAILGFSKPHDYPVARVTLRPEDFIVNKLSRKDRGVQDEMDVVSVLERQKRKLGYEYLAKRAKAADVMELLQALTGRLA
jgi:hypothetical protein